MVKGFVVTKKARSHYFGGDIMSKCQVTTFLRPEVMTDCEINMKSLGFKSKSAYIAKAVEFYNGFLHAKNNKDYIAEILLTTIEGRMSLTEDRIARLLFKQAVEISKLYRFLALAFQLSPEDMDAIHYDCVKEVKRTNGSISYPAVKGEGE